MEQFEHYNKNVLLDYNPNYKINDWVNNIWRTIVKSPYWEKPNNFCVYSTIEGREHNSIPYKYGVHMAPSSKKHDMERVEKVSL